MLVREEWPIRGCRPGRCGVPEEGVEEAQSVRMANVEIYAKRAKAGLPIFRDAGGSPPALSGGKSGSVAV